MTTSQLLFRQTDDSDDAYQTWFVEVVLPLKLPQTYTYRVPNELNKRIAVGQRIVVQFGKKKIYTALIVEIHQNPPKVYTAKYFLEILDEKPIINELQLKFWRWVADYYCCTIGEVMDAAMPGNMKMESETKISLHPNCENTPYALSEKEKTVLDVLQLQKVLTIGDIEQLLHQKTILPLIKTLYEKGCIVLREEVAESYKAKKETFVKPAFDTDHKSTWQNLFEILEKAPKQSDILLAFKKLYQNEPILKRKLLKTANASSAALDGLAEKGILEVFEAEVDRVLSEDGKGWDYTLNAEQEKAIASVKDLYKDKDVVLLHGVTGSGKTHVFMHMMDETISQGKQALYLVPEIALTAQLIQRLRAKYGKDIGIYHSKFNADERVEIWSKVLHKEYKIVLGVRSALFLPFAELGLLIIDEEHEHTFKQFEPAPRYHARDAGIFLMNLHGG
ncbi:MAG: primosomal protein N' family DNA-binding protein, partial [Bacteroidia bacterium]